MDTHVGNAEAGAVAGVGTNADADMGVDGADTDASGVDPYSVIWGDRPCQIRQTCGRWANYGKCVERGVLCRSGPIEGCTERLVAEANANSKSPGRSVGGLRENTLVEGIQRWVNWTRLSLFSRCLSSEQCLSFLLWASRS